MMFISVIKLKKNIFILLRYLFMAWGTKKFTKNLIRPNASSNNNALVSFMSRVPDNEELVSIFFNVSKINNKSSKAEKKTLISSRKTLKNFTIRIPKKLFRQSPVVESQEESWTMIKEMYLVCLVVNYEIWKLFLGC